MATPHSGDPETSTGRQSAADENPDVEGGDHGPAVEEDAKKQLSPEGAAEEEMEIAKAELIGIAPSLFKYIQCIVHAFIMVYIV